jgi:hypothetical protein
VTGERYLSSLTYSADNIWRNFGIIWAFWLLFVVITIVATCRWNERAGIGGLLRIPREKTKNLDHVFFSRDEESQGTENKAQNSSTSLSNDSTIQTQDSRDEDSRMDTQLIHNTSVFTWKDLTYSVKTPAGERVLLDNVQGWVKPCMLGALMGASGASQPQFWTSNRWLSRPMRAFDALLLSALMTLAVGAPPLVFAIFQNSDPPGNLGAMPQRFERVTNTCVLNRDMDPGTIRIIL